MPKYTLYQLYAELEDYKPKIWRRFQVTNDITVAMLGYVTQVLFEMTASHLMSLEVPIGRNMMAMLEKRLPKEKVGELVGEGYEENVIYFEIPNEKVDMISSSYTRAVADATQAKLRNALGFIGDKIYVYYDFGDDWRVCLTLEAITKVEESASEFPRVLAGAGFGIIEDVGGTYGLENLAKAFKKRRGKDFISYCEWLEGRDDYQWIDFDTFDMAMFDLVDMNYRVKKIPRIYKQAYENEMYPTKKSCDLIDRKYLSKKA